MSEWVPIDEWQACRRMERPGIVFEVRNANGQTFLTNCTIPLPIPADWTVKPTDFRAVPAERPRHSTPIPKPEQR